MKSDAPMPVYHQGIWHDRVVRHISSSYRKGITGTVRIGMQVWNVSGDNDAYHWHTTGLSDRSYGSGGRNARLLKTEV